MTLLVDVDIHELKVMMTLDMEGNLTFTPPGPPRIFKTRLEGTKEKNVDGRERQEIISQCRKGEPVELVRTPDPDKYINYGNYLVQVFRRSGEQIGHIGESVARKSMLPYEMEHGVGVTAKISEITGEPSDLGCIIEITREDVDWKEADECWEKDKEAKKIILEAVSLEKIDPDKAILLYRKAMRLLMEIDERNKTHLMPWRYERYPIASLTMLLETRKQYRECLEEIEQYDSLGDRMGLTRYDGKELEKRKIRLKELVSDVRI